MDVKKKLEGAISPYKDYCDGYNSPQASGKNYLTGVVLDVGITKKKYSHEGSIVLDSILAFDRAEVETAYIGQINMITVSSFCGLPGLIWGYDIAKHPNNEKEHLLFPDKSIYDEYNNNNIPVYSAVTLKEATYRLFGAVNKKRFPLIPGAHVPCAGKHISINGPKHIYAAFALAIAKNRKKDACLFMEDIGEIKNNCSFDKKNSIKSHILENITKSVVLIGKNQLVQYEKIFIDIVDISIKKDEVGCALVCAPYFTIAKDAIPKGSISSLIKQDLYKWEKDVEKKFLYKK